LGEVEMEGSEVSTSVVKWSEVYLGDVDMKGSELSTSVVKLSEV
jgi:hypothetical protein